MATAMTKIGRSRRRSTVKEAAQMLEGFIIEESGSIVGESGHTKSPESTKRVDRIRNQDRLDAKTPRSQPKPAPGGNGCVRLFSLYEKPLRTMFAFYCKLTSHQNEHGIPAKIVRTHLSFNHTAIMLRDFRVVPARLGNSQLQDMFHATKTGRDDSEDAMYVNWMSYTELQELLLKIAKMDSFFDKKKQTPLEEKLSRLFEGFDHGVAQMQKRGAAQLPRFLAVALKEKKRKTQRRKRISPRQDIRH